MSGADFLQLDRSGAPPRGITDWLTAQIRDAIADGRLGLGDRLPPTRTLADDIGVSRGVVVETFGRLTEEGLLASRTRTGTVVVGEVVRRSAERVATPEPVPAHGYPATTDAPVQLDLSPGVPDLTAFPRGAWLRLEREVLTKPTSADLGYGDPRGHPNLRQALAGWLARTRGVRAVADDVVVVSGVAQALALLARVLPLTGRTALAVEDPGSRGAVDELEYWGLSTTSVPVDDQGIDVAALARSGADAALVTPAHQFPTGVVLGAERRAALVRWAAAGGIVIEDDYDADQRYDRTPVAALQPLGPDRVVHCGSVSKSLAPGMRLGWMVPPTKLHHDLVEAKRHTDLSCPVLPQLVLARMIETGEYERHLRRQRVRQRARRDALVAALSAQVPGILVHGVAAGVHLLAMLPGTTLDDTKVTAALATAGVRVQPLSWHRHDPGPPGLVMGYAALTPHRLRRAAAIIGGVLRDH